MSVNIFDVGDEVGYPYPTRPSERKMTVLDRNIIQYGSGKMFVQYLYDNLLEHMVEDMHTNVENEFDNLVVISGREGSGKSNLAYHICKLYQPDFSIEDGYIYEFESFIKKLSGKDRGADKGRVFWMDEATNIASNRDWMKSDNKAFIQMLEMMRSRGWTLVMCIPSVMRLDVYIREYRLRYLLIAKEMGWENNTTRRRGFVEVKYPQLGGKWFTIGYAQFPKMDPDVKELYEEVKLNHQEERICDLKEQTEVKGRGWEAARKDKKRLRAVMLALNEQGVAAKDIAVISGYSYSHVRDILIEARAERERGDGI